MMASMSLSGYLIMVMVLSFGELDSNVLYYMMWSPESEVPRYRRMQEHYCNGRCLSLECGWSVWSALYCLPTGCPIHIKRWNRIPLHSLKCWRIQYPISLHAQCWSS
jgi:hypothetical protein